VVVIENTEVRELNLFVCAGESRKAPTLLGLLEKGFEGKQENIL
jgi:hypothetical protein